MTKTEGEQKKGCLSIAPWLALFATLIGIFNFAQTNFDRFAPPGWETVLPASCVADGVMPIAVHATGRENANLYGIGAVVKFRNGGRKSFITGIEIIGEVNVSYDTYLWLFDKHEDNMPLDKYGDEWEERRPFIRIKWQGAVTNESGTLSLEPRETAFVKFTFGKPRWMLPGFPADMDKSVGCRDGSKLATAWYPEVCPEYLFLNAIPSRRPNKLSDELKSGQVCFRVFINNEVVELAAKDITVGKVVEDKAWGETTGYVIYNGDQAGPYTSILK
jgi:hypothetical protein